MKNCLIIYLFITVSIVFASEIEKYQNDILQLFQNVGTFEYPTNHSDFYREQFDDGGTYGKFDFIIIGAGSAGTVLANRLSEISQWKILVLEGGGNDTTYTDIPAMAGLLQFTEHSWAYKTIPQTGCCLAMDNQQCNIPRGKILGGSSSINYMVYTRGNQRDYDLWKEAGNCGWSYKDLFPYFLKMENSSLQEMYDEGYHSSNGSLHVEHMKHFTEFGQAFMDANAELGRQILDYNGEEQLGFSRPQMNTINGRRCSGNKAFLAPARAKRSNIKVETNAFVIKILINENSKTAYGVEFVKGDKKYKVLAKKEIILSAGSVGSPHLLMLSGIGPKQHLEELGINVLLDLPVGQNLADHPFYFLQFNSNFTDPGIKPLDEMIQEYLNGYGYLTNPGNIQSLGFITIDENNTYPDIEYIFIPYFATNDGFIKRGFGLNDETLKSITDEIPEGTVTALTILQHPKSRGSITLKSNNPFDHPLIDLNYFSVQEDADVLVASIKDLIKVVTTTEAMQKYNVSVANTPIPACEDFPYLEDDYLQCAVRQLATTLHHLMGTCKMGPPNDEHSVVDPELKVIGAKKLRVVDASILPLPITGHTNVPTYTVAEKASDLIKKKYFGLMSFYDQNS